LTNRPAIVQTPAFVRRPAYGSSAGEAAFVSLFVPVQVAKKAVEMWKTELLANCAFSVLAALAGRRQAV
jgi:hypothetical protein